MKWKINIMVIYIEKKLKNLVIIQLLTNSRI